MKGKPRLLFLKFFLGNSFRIQERLETQSGEDDFASLEGFDPGRCHQQVAMAT